MMKLRDGMSEVDDDRMNGYSGNSGYDGYSGNAGNSGNSGRSGKNGTLRLEKGIYMRTKNVSRKDSFGSYHLSSAINDRSLIH